MNKQLNEKYKNLIHENNLCFINIQHDRVYMCINVYILKRVKWNSNVPRS